MTSLSLFRRQDGELSFFRPCLFLFLPGDLGQFSLFRLIPIHYLSPRCRFGTSPILSVLAAPHEPHVEALLPPNLHLFRDASVFGFNKRTPSSSLLCVRLLLFLVPEPSTHRRLLSPLQNSSSCLLSATEKRCLAPLPHPVNSTRTSYPGLSISSPFTRSQNGLYPLSPLLAVSPRLFLSGPQFFLCGEIWHFYELLS